MKTTILMIDDEKDFCLAVKKNFESTEEYSVLLAHSGQEGIRSALRHRPDVILLDIRMPEMDGMDVLKILKSDQKTLSIPVLMLTAVRDMETQREAASLYDEGYIEKPVEMQVLQSRIKQILSRAGGKWSPSK